MIPNSDLRLFIPGADLVQLTAISMRLDAMEALINLPAKTIDGRQPDDGTYSHRHPIRALRHRCPTTGATLDHVLHERPGPDQRNHVMLHLRNHPTIADCNLQEPLRTDRSNCPTDDGHHQRSVGWISEIGSKVRAQAMHVLAHGRPRDTMPPTSLATYGAAIATLFGSTIDPDWERQFIPIVRAYPPSPYGPWKVTVSTAYDNHDQDHECLSPEAARSWKNLVPPCASLWLENQMRPDTIRLTPTQIFYDEVSVCEDPLETLKAFALLPGPALPFQLPKTLRSVP